MQVTEWLATGLGRDIWNRKYRYDNETFDEWLDRVSGKNEDIKKLIIEKKFLFGGRILASRGLQNKGRKITFSNCYVITPPEDNIESIFDCAKKLARTYSYGGGCGIDISKLSPRNAKINNAAKETSGSVSFMDLYSLVTQLIGQQGRRGALMISLDCRHPDLEEFINVKSDLNKITKANISIRITDEFMNAVKNDLDWKLTYTRQETGETVEKIINAKRLFRRLAEMNWDYAEPGLLNWDKICKWNLLSEDKNFSYAGVNPCIPLGEYVLTNNGFVKIENIEQEIALQGRSYKCSDLIHSGRKMVYEVELENGIIIKMTDNHKILTINGDMELKNLMVGDKVCVDYTPVFNTIIDDFNDYEKGIIAGWFISDGSFMKHHNINDYMIHFSVGVKEFEYAKILEHYIQKHLDENFKFKPHSQKNNTCLEGKVCKQNIVNKFKKEILNINNWNKYDINFKDKSKSFKLGFIRGIFTCDGSSHSSAYALYCSKEKDFLYKIQRLLMEFGAYSNLTLHNKAKIYTAKDGKVRNNSDSWKLEIYDTEFIKIGYLTSYKQDKLLEKAIKTPKRILNKKYNIKIKSIKAVGEEDVYDINVAKVHHFNLNGVIVHNCAEEPLPAGGSCLLGSINLSKFVINPFTKDAKFNFNDFKDTVRLGVFALNEVLHEGLPLHPLQEQKESVNNWRQIGLGILGWHDALIKLGIRYGDQKSLKLANRIGFDMIDTAISYSAQLTDRYGTYPMFNYNYISQSKFFIENTSESTKEIVKQKGLANSQLLTIAPTGSIGTMLGVSTGIEPIYEFSYTRKTESLYGKDEYYKVYTPIVKEYISLKNSNKLPDYFNTAMTLNYKERIEMQSVWQKYIDASISSTVNVPTDFSVEEVEDLYKLAWKKGLKGVTIYRSGCKRDGILKSDNMDNIEENILVWGTTIESSDDLIGKKRKIMSGCGSIHIVAFFDFADGKLMEIFLNKGSQGGCNSWMTSNSRTISAALRTGTSFEYLMDQLKSAPACPSYVTRTAIKKDTSKGHCCPAAVANALEEMQNEVFDELGIFEEEEREKIRKIIVNQCPECGEELKFEGGCNSCSNCGYSKCD